MLLFDYDYDIIIIITPYYYPVVCLEKNRKRKTAQLVQNSIAARDSFGGREEMELGAIGT